MKNFWQKLNKPIIALAPMAGITDSAFRLLCRDYGTDVVYSEMISADGLVYGNYKTLELLRFKKEEKPLVIQLFGRRPESFAIAARIISALDIDGIDINLGCPAKKVFSHGSGAALMNDLPRAKKIIKAVLDNTSLPVSIKCRASVKGVTVLDLIKKIKGLPVASLMIHGRSYEGKFSGQIDYEIIKKAKKLFPGIVLANGGIKTPEDARMMLQKTGADGIGLAQGVLGKPWLFKQIKDYFKKGDYCKLSLKETKKVALSHAKLMYNLKPNLAPLEMRKHLAWYMKGFPGASRIRKKLVLTSSLKEIRKILN